MPELPEVETIRQSLTSLVVGRSFRSVRRYRQDIIHHDRRPVALLQGHLISEIRRHGKELALVGDDTHSERCAIVHLGMSGSLLFQKPGIVRGTSLPTHTHVTWSLDDGSRILFRDPRRFGGIWTFPSLTTLWDSRWRFRGPDALVATSAKLYENLSHTRRAIKTTLLDQSVVAGLGNIYTDELLFDCQLHPLLPANRLSINTVRHLVRRLRALLRRAIADGGSSTRDYVHPNGQRGQFSQRHAVYGCGGMPCPRCTRRLQTIQLSGRGTTFCSRCQRVRT